MDAPPSRYRVVEHGGRLVVIDTVAGGMPPTARDLLEAEGESFSAASYPREGGDPESPAAAPVILDSRLRGNTEKAYATPPSSPSPTPKPPGAATMVAGGKRDDRGRLLWTTARWYDAKGPRTLTLTAAGESRLGNSIGGLVVVAVLAVIFVAAGGVIGWAIIVGAIVFARQTKPLVTAWIDRLARA